MGYSVTSYAGLGVIIDAMNSNFWADSDRPTCPHPERIGNTFCPKCGVRVGRTGTPEAIALKDRFQSVIDGNYSSDEGYCAVRVGYEDNSTLYFVGYTLVLSSYREDTLKSFQALPSEDEVKAHLKDMLEPFDLYNERTFGFHSVMYHSY